jgi:2-hydroxy-6-oxonona-2,4-dienedioate hydrolase
MTFWTDLLDQEFRVDRLDVAGVATRVLRSGAGEPIIFLHGISGHLETFVPCVRFYRGEYALHLLDMLGHGWTDKVGGDLTIDRLSDHVIAYMDSQGIAKAHIVGLSLGGWTAGWMAAHHPDRVLTTTLVAAAGNLAMGRPEFGEGVRSSTSAGVLSDDRENTRKRLQRVILRTELLSEELVDVRFTIYQMPAFRRELDGLLALTWPDIYAKYALTPNVLGKITGEVLVVWGEDDDRSGVADGNFLVDHIEKSKIVQMDGTGHWPPYERPEDFAALHKAVMRHGLDSITSGRC